jgi:hypothetical protein
MTSLNTPIPRPTDKHSPNGIARITPKDDRPDAKLAWSSWVEAKRQYYLTLGPDPGEFSYPGLDYNAEFDTLSLRPFNSVITSS